MKPKLSKHIASTLAACRKKRLADGAPAFDKVLLEQARWHLERAERDCQTLDEKEKDQDGYFVRHLHEGLADTNAVSSLHAYLTFPPDGRKARTINMAFGKSEAEGRAAFYLHHMREMIRDRYPADSALKAIPSAFIRERHKAGDVHFFELLGSELGMIRTKPRKYQRSIEEWLRRIWLTFCLWRYDTVEDPWPLIKRAALAGGMAAEIKPLESERGWGQFVKAWRNLRTRRR